MGNLFALIPKLMEALSLFKAIKLALANGENILQVLNRMGGELVTFFTEIAKTLFPNLSTAGQAAAGMMMIDVDYVKEVQTALNALETAGLEVDGIYGPQTKAAVTAFQKKHGLEADGWAGRATNGMIQLKLAEKVVPSAVENIKL